MPRAHRRVPEKSAQAGVSFRRPDLPLRLFPRNPGSRIRRILCLSTVQLFLMPFRDRESARRLCNVVPKCFHDLKLLRQTQSIELGKIGTQEIGSRHRFTGNRPYHKYSRTTSLKFSSPPARPSGDSSRGTPICRWRFRSTSRPVCRGRGRHGFRSAAESARRRPGPAAARRQI